MKDNEAGNVTMSQYNAIQMGEFIRYLEAYVGLRDFNPLEIHSFKIGKGGAIKLLDRKKSLLELITVNRDKVHDFLTVNGYDIDVYNACTVIVANYDYAIGILNDHIQLLEGLAFGFQPRFLKTNDPDEPPF